MLDPVSWFTAHSSNSGFQLDVVQEADPLGGVGPSDLDGGEVGQDRHEGSCRQTRLPSELRMLVEPELVVLVLNRGNFVVLGEDGVGDVGACTFEYYIRSRWDRTVLSDSEREVEELVVRGPFVAQVSFGRHEIDVLSTQGVDSKTLRDGAVLHLDRPSRIIFGFPTFIALSEHRLHDKLRVASSRDALR